LASVVGKKRKSRREKKMARTSSISEKPISHGQRRLADWVNPTNAKKVHSLVDKVYKMKNLEMAWLKVKKNKGASGMDGVGIREFEENLSENLKRLHEELKSDIYQPQPVKEKLIPKSGQPGKYRPLGIPTVYDRVCQQALLNRLEPIFEPIFDEANFGYRKGKSPKDALRKIWKEIDSGREWIVDADLRNFFGTADHTKLMTLVNKRVSDGRILRTIEKILKAGCYAEGKILATEQGTPQGAVVSPMLSNVLLTPFDKEMRHKGYKLTRFADDWVITCETRKDAEKALAEATRILVKLGVELHKDKTKICHVRYGFEFLGYKIKRGTSRMKLRKEQIKSKARAGMMYAFPREKSIEHFKDQIRKRSSRKAPINTRQLIEELNPVIRGWGNYYRKAHVRKLFQKLDGWIVCRIWSHKHKRWRNTGWRKLPKKVLYGEMKLVSLISLIPEIAMRRKANTCESRILETGTYGLSGGRRPA
jgi:group II intron reverse transcriptase/maturase